LRASHSHPEWNADDKNFHTSVAIRSSSGDSHVSNGERVWVL
jgi:hypothetical protein